MFLLMICSNNDCLPHSARTKIFEMDLFTSRIRFRNCVCTFSISEFSQFFQFKSTKGAQASQSNNNNGAIIESKNSIRVSTVKNLCGIVKKSENTTLLALLLKSTKLGTNEQFLPLIVMRKYFKALVKSNLSLLIEKL